MQPETLSNIKACQIPGQAIEVRNRFETICNSEVDESFLLLPSELKNTGLNVKKIAWHTACEPHSVWSRKQMHFLFTLPIIVNIGPY